MELSWIFAAIFVVGVALAAFFLAGRFGKKRREMSRAGLSRRVAEEAESLRAFVDGRESNRPERDSVVKEHDLSSHRVMLHDEGTMEMYDREHLPEVAELRRQMRGHGVRNETLDSLFESSENASDLRSVSTALSEMARRLRESR